MPTFTVFSRPISECVGCRGTEISFSRKNIPVNKVMIDQDDDAMEFVKWLGHSTAPVVLVEDNGVVLDHWSGFHEDNILKWRAHV